ncbi:MAG TPA: hypothetical protein VII47_11245 [Actinomycetota bacterium]
MRRSIPVLLMVTAVLVSTVVPAGSSQNPPGCMGNNPALNVSRDKTLIRNGDVLTYRVEVSNLSTPTSSACDISAATVTLTLPAADGTPTGQQVVLKTGLDLPAETGLTGFPPVPWTVALNPGVVDAVVKAEVAGILHDTPPTDHSASVTKTLGTDVTTPLTTLTVSASVTSGQAPLAVVYTYTERNTGDTPISGLVLTDDVCAPVVYTGGDANVNSVMDKDETWTFTCSTTLSQAGTVTNHVVARGHDVRDGRVVPDELAQAAVEVSSPPTSSPPPPVVQGQQTQPGVLPRTL